MGAQGSQGETVPARFVAVVAAAGIDGAWLDAVAAEITTNIHAELPEPTDDDLSAATYASSRSILGLFLAMLEAGRDPAEAEPPEPAVAYAREFVRRGLPVERLLRTYQVGQTCFYRRFTETIRARIADPETVALAMEQGARWTFEFLDVILPGLVRRYAEERDRWVRSAAAVRQETVQALLAGTDPDLEATSQRLGYRLGWHHRAFVLWQEGGGEGDAAGAALERGAAELAARLGAGDSLLVPFGPRLVSGWLGSHEPLPQLPAADPPAIGGDARVAFGTSAEGLVGFRRSHDEAMQARRVARLAAAGPGSVTAYADISLVALATADLDRAQRFIAAELGPLAGPEGATPRLAETARAYLEEQSSPRRTAQRLGVHENTIANRIRNVEELLGRPLDQRVPETLVALRLAATLASGSEHPAAPRLR
jgi:hypothetical protein